MNCRPEGRGANGAHPGRSARSALRKVVPLLTGPLLALSACTDEAPPGERDYLNIRYIIEGSAVELVEGVSRATDIPGSSPTVETRHMGDPLRKDLNGDGREDIAHILTQERGGTGTFFYLVAALASESGLTGSGGYLLGDRILAGGLESGPGLSLDLHIIDRGPGDPMSAAPSVTRTLRLLLDPEEMNFDTVSVGSEPAILP